MGKKKPEFTIKSKYHWEGPFTCDQNGNVSKGPEKEWRTIEIETPEGSPASVSHVDGSRPSSVDLGNFLEGAIDLINKPKKRARVARAERTATKNKRQARVLEHFKKKNAWSPEKGWNSFYPWKEMVKWIETELEVKRSTALRDIKWAKNEISKK